MTEMHSKPGVRFLALLAVAALERSDMSAIELTESPHPTIQSAAFVELRQYTLHPGQREVLIELFDREFIESQEAVGMTVIGQFRDLDRPDFFVWLRGFPDMPSRAASLAAFYDGPVWAAHRAKANPTMIDASNVLLLEPAFAATTFPPADRPPKGAAASPAPGLIVATIHYPRRGAMAVFPAFFAESVRPVLASTGAAIVAEYVTSSQANNFPRLAVREGETAFVWLARFSSPTDYERHRQSLAADARWQRVERALEAQLAKPTETLRLVPTSRSRLRG
jgi:hypothetical protein